MGRPPLMWVLLVIAIVGTIGLAFSPLGTRLIQGLPVSALVGYQSFRIPVEIVLALLVAQDALPIQMTIEGRNWDLRSSLTAISVAILAVRGRLPHWGLFLWNLLGLGLLLNSMVISLLSVPLPIQVSFNKPDTCGPHMRATRWFAVTPPEPYMREVSG